MKINKILLIILIITLFSNIKISHLQDLYNFNLHFSDDTTAILLDVDEESSVKVFIDVTGKLPQKLTLEVSYDGIIGLPTFMYWKFPNNNVARNKYSIYNRFIISTFIDTLLKYNYGTGVYELIFTAKAYNNRDIVVGSKTDKYKVIIAPAILSEHKVAKGSQNVIKWIDSDILQMAIVDANDMTTSTLVDNFTNVLNKSNQNKIFTF